MHACLIVFYIYRFYTMVAIIYELLIEILILYVYTYLRAHAAVVADKFHARCITFENVSGAENGQAVALRSQGDQSVFYRCEFLGHQDTLYVNGGMRKDPSGRNVVTGRHFFRECDVYGSVDFIFGDAQMVLQKCNIKFRTPRVGGGINVITAQGRMDKKSNTGIVLHCCSITAAGDFNFKAGPRKGYLGRTWQKYSRTVVMNSFIDGVIDPAGWLEMNGNAQTADYTEYNNRGPGSSTTDRVRWPGYKATKNPDDAMPFSVETFIDGSSWLPPTNVPFDLRLSC